MGFLMPKAPKPVTPAAPPTPPSSPIYGKENPLSQSAYGAASLISTSPSGLKRKATTQRVSLIGG